MDTKLKDFASSLDAGKLYRDADGDYFYLSPEGVLTIAFSFSTLAPFFSAARPYDLEIAVKDGLIPVAQSDRPLTEELVIELIEVEKASAPDEFPIITTPRS